MLFENNYTVNECHSNDFNHALKLISLLLIKSKKTATETTVLSEYY